MKTKTYTVCITGCLGFIGSHLTRQCLNRGWRVWGVDKITYAANPHLLKEFESYGNNFLFSKVDINDLDRLYDVDAILNLAAESHVDNSISRSKEFLRSNINGVHKLLELIRIKKERPLFIHTSTDEVYGDCAIGSHNEKDLLKPSNPYSSTKAAADHLVQSWSRTYGLPYVIVRPTNNYGLYQYPEKLIPKVCRCLLTGRKIPLHNYGTPKRMWLHAEDTSNAIIKIVESGVHNEIYNVSGNCELTNIEVVKKILNLYFKKEINNVEDYCDFSCHRDGQDIRYSLNDDKLKSLGWKPLKIFDEELPKIVEYYKSNFVW